MNLGSFGWKLRYGGKGDDRGRGYDQNSSLLTEEDEPDSPPLVPAGGKSDGGQTANSMVLFQNDMDFEDFLKAGESTELTENRGTIPSSQTKSRQAPQASLQFQEGVLLDFLAPSIFEPPPHNSTTQTQTKPNISTPTSNLTSPYNQNPNTIDGSFFPPHGNHSQPEKTTDADGDFGEDFGDFCSYSNSDFGDLPKKETPLTGNLFLPTPLELTKTSSEPGNKLRHLSQPSSTLPPSSFPLSHPGHALKEESFDTIRVKHWPVLSQRALEQFDFALIIFIKLDQVATAKDRLLLSDYSPIRTYVTALFDIHSVLENLRAATKLRNFLVPIPQDDLLLSRWSDLINLFVKLSIASPPRRPSLTGPQSEGRFGYCKLCLYPFTQPNHPPHHSHCEQLLHVTQPTSPPTSLPSPHSVTTPPTQSLF